MNFSLVIPCYNEAANIPALLDHCWNIVSVPDREVIFVDNGSTDNTPGILKELLPRYPNYRSVRVEMNLGYGHGIMAGLRAAKGRILGWTHADLQTDPYDVVRGLSLFSRFGESILVKGRRYGRPWGDVFFTVGTSVFETLLFRKVMWDINGQPTLFPRSFFETWRDPPLDYSLDLYAYYLARAKGVRVYRFPVKFVLRAHGVSHWNGSWAAKKKFIRQTVGNSLCLKKRLFR